jgi:DNA-binding response OmpR family regulator
MKTRSVLIVDDDDHLRRTMATALAREGLAIAEAASGEEAAVKADAGAFDLILLDLQLPDQDGLATLRKMRERGVAAAVAIVTGHGSLPSAIEAMRLGAVDFLQKPFDPAALRALVATILARADLADSAEADAPTLLELARRAIHQGELQRAMAQVRRAIAAEPANAEAFNLLGVLFEIRGDLGEAHRHYHLAYSADPAYEPARRNLDRLVRRRPRGHLWLGGEGEKVR